MTIAGATTSSDSQKPAEDSKEASNEDKTVSEKSDTKSVTKSVCSDAKISVSFSMKNGKGSAINKKLKAFENTTIGMRKVEHAVDEDDEICNDSTIDSRN